MIPSSGLSLDNFAGLVLIRKTKVQRRYSKEHDMGDFLTTLFGSAMHSSAQGFVGVACIWIYFAVMIWAIVLRVRRGEHVH
jgi:hypothetical protein